VGKARQKGKIVHVNISVHNSTREEKENKRDSIPVCFTPIRKNADVNVSQLGVRISLISKIECLNLYSASGSALVTPPKLLEPTNECCTGSPDSWVPGRLATHPPVLSTRLPCPSSPPHPSPAPPAQCVHPPSASVRPSLSPHPSPNRPPARPARPA
jgi:hypothetical protein